MKKNKMILGLFLLICALVCGQIHNIYANYIIDENIVYKELEDGTTLISGFEKGTKVSEIISNCFSSEYTVKIFDKNNNDITNESDKPIGTDYKINLYEKSLNNEENLISAPKKTYKVVLYGDTNGDTNIGAVDALAIVKNKVEAQSFSSIVYEEAGRVLNSTREKGTIPASNDALYIVKYVLYCEEYPINQKLYVEEEKEDVPVIGSTTPAGIHGELKVDGTNIIDKNGDIFQLKGVSTHGIAWHSQYVNKETFKYLRDTWKINTIRLAMYSNPDDGYTRELWNTVQNGVDYATETGLYVIIDWHILNDNNPNTYKTESIEFFKTMATKYKNNPNVIYEICNEPNGSDVTWQEDIKPYAEEVISEIRKIDDNAIIICGTPTWSQDVDIVAENPITNYENIMYSLHFYAATHKEDLRTKLTTALDKGLPIFVSEFGISDASGNGAIDEDEADEWIKILNKNNLSWICWNLSNKNETSSLLLSTTEKTTDWTEDELSDSGKWLRKRIGISYIFAKYNESDEQLVINVKDLSGITSVEAVVSINNNEQKYNLNNSTNSIKNSRNEIIELQHQINIRSEDLKIDSENNEIEGGYETSYPLLIQVVVENNLGFTTTYNYKYGYTN